MYFLKIGRSDHNEVDQQFWDSICHTTGLLHYIARRENKEKKILFVQIFTNQYISHWPNE